MDGGEFARGRREPVPIKPPLMKVLAKCQNFSGCVLAYRGDKLELDSDAPLVCPECGKPLAIAKGSTPWGAIAGVAVVLLLAAGGYAYFTLPKSSQDPAPKPAEVPAKIATATPVPADPPTASVPDAPNPQEPASGLIAPENVELDANQAENKSVKTEVLSRIDFMPNISKGNKDKLYNSVERARSMGKVLTIPFSSGQTTITGNDTLALKNALEAPAILKLRDDPTAVFVVLGYADSKGDEKKNLAVSQARADNVLSVMKDKCKVANVMHAVAMGGSSLLDSKNLEKNRIVEVWAVLP